MINTGRRRLDRAMLTRMLNSMAQIILEDPYITAKELARRLGYADEKAVYYWTLRSSYKGLTGFKRAVLSGQYRIQGTVAREPNQRYGRVPVITGFRDGREPLLSGEAMTVVGVPAAQWAWRYPGPAVGPFLPDDILLLGYWPAPSSTTWCVAQQQDTNLHFIRLIIGVKDDAKLLDPTAMNIDAGSWPRYTIHQLIRSL